MSKNHKHEAKPKEIFSPDSTKPGFLSRIKGITEEIKERFSPTEQDAPSAVEADPEHAAAPLTAADAEKAPAAPQGLPPEPIMPVPSAAAAQTAVPPTIVPSSEPSVSTADAAPKASDTGTAGHVPAAPAMPPEAILPPEAPVPPAEGTPSEEPAVSPKVDTQTPAEPPAPPVIPLESLCIGADPEATLLRSILCGWAEAEALPYRKILVFDNDPAQPLSWMQNTVSCTDLMGNSLYFDAAKKPALIGALFTLLAEKYYVCFVLSALDQDLMDTLSSMEWLHIAVQQKHLVLLQRGTECVNYPTESDSFSPASDARLLMLPRNASMRRTWFDGQAAALQAWVSSAPARQQPADTLYLGYNAAGQPVTASLEEGHLFCVESYNETQNPIEALVRGNLDPAASKHLLISYYSNRKNVPVFTDPSVSVHVLSGIPDWASIYTAISQDIVHVRQQHLLIVFDLDIDIPARTLDVLCSGIRKAQEADNCRVSLLYGGALPEEAPDVIGIKESAQGVCGCKLCPVPFRLPPMPVPAISADPT